MNEQVAYATMSDREKYLFDLQGFLVVKNFLESDEIQAFNEAIEANQDKRGEHASGLESPELAGTHKRGHYASMLTWDKPWCQPFRDILAHRKLVPYLNTFFGRGWKLDHSPDTLTATKGAKTSTCMAQTWQRDESSCIGLGEAGSHRDNFVGS